MSYLSPMFHGAYTALVTPMRGGGVDHEALRRLVSDQIARGIDGLVPCGTTGESPALTAEEHVAIVRTVLDETRKRVPVVPGAGSNSTRHTVELAKACKAAGADGLLLVTPYYVKPTQPGLVAHYRHVLAEAKLPAILYNVPSRTGGEILPDTVLELCAVPEVVAVKEASGNILRTQQILERCGDRITVLSGDDALTLGILAVGGRGVISVSSNVAPDRVAAVCRAFLGGDVARARALHYELLPLHEVLFVETSPGPVKAAVAMIARLGVLPEIRLPLVMPDAATLDRVAAVLGRLGIT